MFTLLQIHVYFTPIPYILSDINILGGTIESQTMNPESIKH